MKKMSRAVVLSLVSFFALAAYGQSKPGSTSGPATTVIGILRSKVVYGPPGFGETPKTDSKVLVFYVQLRTPLTPDQLHLSPTGGAEPRKSYSELQLWCGDGFVNCEEFLRANTNQAILASGVAAYALEANDVFPVTMIVGALDTK